jgi:hypothetical protein
MICKLLATLAILQLSMVIYLAAVWFNQKRKEAREWKEEHF